jgi:hypothetical protein
MSMKRTSRPSGSRNALNLWHRGGAAAADVAFWAPHAEMFDSPKAYGLVIANLLERGGLVTSMALMMHWLEQAERIGLEKGDTSFFELAEHWIYDLRRRAESPEAGGADLDAWNMACKFLERLEANADQYWDVPGFELARSGPALREKNWRICLAGMRKRTRTGRSCLPPAWEDVVYKDTTDDGIDSELLEEGPVGDDEFVCRIEAVERAAGVFESGSASLATGRHLPFAVGRVGVDDRRSARRRAVDSQAVAYRHQLRELLDEIAAFRLPRPAATMIRWSSTIGSAC